MEALLHRTADKYLSRLNATDRDRINAAIDDLEKEPPEGDIEPITGQPGRFEDIPDISLSALKPLLTHLADDYWKPVTEPANMKEAVMIDKRVKEYEKAPSSFVSRKRKR